ncbi:MAG: hypothetical protein ACRD0M_10550, partial [Acidimicrobiales bacterium]
MRGRRDRRDGYRRVVAGAIAGIVLGALVPAAGADNVVADGDGLTPVAAAPVAFGPVCRGSSVTKPALLAVTRSGGVSSNQVFADGATVTMAPTVVSGFGLSAAMSSDA